MRPHSVSVWPSVCAGVVAGVGSPGVGWMGPLATDDDDGAALAMGLATEDGDVEEEPQAANATRTRNELARRIARTVTDNG
jgi:hypothetical protein